jgi:hypothetical protein
MSPPFDAPLSGLWALTAAPERQAKFCDPSAALRSRQDDVGGVLPELPPFISRDRGYFSPSIRVRINSGIWRLVLF